MAVAIETVGLEKRYRQGTRTVEALRGIDLKIEEGEFVALLGSSGAGKTTLLQIIGLLDRPTGGTLALLGQDVTHLDRASATRLRGTTVGFVFQEFCLVPELTALENVALPATLRAQVAPADPHAWLKRVGLGDRLHHTPRQLSGGQMQRVALARALVGSPRLLLADEPTGHLDSETAHEIFELLADLNARDGLTILAATHDAELAARAGRQVRLEAGQLREGTRP